MPVTPTAATLKKYGLTKFDYLRLLDLQGGVCGLCGRPPKKRPLVVDHSHVTNEVRGLLHLPCNVSLGYYEAGLFESYIRYGSIENAAFRRGWWWAHGALVRVDA